MSFHSRLRKRSRSLAPLTLFTINEVNEDRYANAVYKDQQQIGRASTNATAKEVLSTIKLMHKGLPLSNHTTATSWIFSNVENELLVTQASTKGVGLVAVPSLVSGSVDLDDGFFDDDQMLLQQVSSK